MEEDIDRYCGKKRSRRTSSILKPTTGPLIDLDPNQQTQDYSIPLKKTRKSSSKRVSFAHKAKIKEFSTDSPQCQWPQDNAEDDKGNEDTRDITQQNVQSVDVVPPQNRFHGRKQIGNTELQTTVHSSLNKYTGFSQADPPITRRPLGYLTDRSIDSYHDDGIEEGRDEKVDGIAFLEEFAGGLGGVTDKQQPGSFDYILSAVRSGFPSDDYVSSEMQKTVLFNDAELDQTEAIGKILMTRDDIGSFQSNRKSEDCFTHEPEKTIVFHNGNCMEQTEVLTGYINCNQTLNSGPVFKGFSDGMAQNQAHMFQCDKTQVFQSGCDIEETKVIDSNICLNGESTQIFSGEKNELYHPCDTNQLVSPDWLFSDKHDTFGKTANEAQVLSHDSNMKETQGVSGGLGNETRIFLQENDMEETQVVTGDISVMLSKDETKTLSVPENRAPSVMSNNSSTCNRAYDYQPNVEIRRRSGIQSNKTQMFQDGLDMEETKMLTGQISHFCNDQTDKETSGPPHMFKNEENVAGPETMNKTKVCQNEMNKTSVVGREMSVSVTDRLPSTHTQIFSSGMDMEETKMLTCQISQFCNDETDRETSGPPHMFKNDENVAGLQTMNKTKVCQNEMNETSVVGREMSVSVTDGRPSTHTQIFSSGMDMEETKMLTCQISQFCNDETDRETSGPPHMFKNDENVAGLQTMNKTKVCQNEMNETSVVGREMSVSVTERLPSTHTQIFSSGMDMEETNVYTSNITNLSRNKTLIFQQGMNMELTNTYDIDPKLQNKTINDGKEKDETQQVLNTTQIDNKTLMFKQGLSMELTSVQEPEKSRTHLNKTVSDCQDMEETRVPETNFLSKTLLHNQVSDNKTLMFNQGLSMELTNVHGVEPTSSELNTEQNNQTKLEEGTSLGENVTSMREDLSTSVVDRPAYSAVPQVTEVIPEGKRAGASIRRSILGLPKIQLKEKSQTPSKNKIRLTADTTQTILTSEVTAMESEPDNIDPVEIPNESSASPKDVTSGSPVKHDSVGSSEIGIDDILPPDDMLTNSTFHSPTKTERSIAPEFIHPSVNTSLSTVKRGVTIPDNISRLNSINNSTIMEVSHTVDSSGTALSNTMLEEMKKEITGPLTFETFFNYLEIPRKQLGMVTGHQLKDYRCSLLPVQAVNTSDLKGVLQAQTIHCPYYKVVNDAYTQAMKHKKDECQSVEQSYVDNPPEIFSQALNANREQREVIKAKVTSLMKTCRHVGNKAWKMLRLQTSQQYFEILKENHLTLQHQYEELKTAANEAEAIDKLLDQAISNLKIEEQELNHKSLISEEDKESWHAQSEELQQAEQKLQDTETERSLIEREHTELKNQIGKLKANINQGHEPETEDSYEELQRLKAEEKGIYSAIDSYMRCLEWRIHNHDKNRMNCLFYKDTLQLEITFDGMERRTLISAEISTCLPENAKSEVKLAHHLIKNAVQEQQILTKYIGQQHKIANLLQDLSMVIMTARCLAREISHIRHYTTFNESSVCVEFLSVKNLLKVDVTFDLHLNYSDYTIIPHVTVAIGDIRSDTVLEQLQGVKKNQLEYFSKLCDAVDLNNIELSMDISS